MGMEGCADRGGGSYRLCALGNGACGFRANLGSTTPGLEETFREMRFLLEGTLRIGAFFSEGQPLLERPRVSLGLRWLADANSKPLQLTPSQHPSEVLRFQPGGGRRRMKRLLVAALGVVAFGLGTLSCRAQGGAAPPPPAPPPPPMIMPPPADGCCGAPVADCGCQKQGLCARIKERFRSRCNDCCTSQCAPPCPAPCGDTCHRSLLDRFHSHKCDCAPPCGSCDGGSSHKLLSGLFHRDRDCCSPCNSCPH
jgi:hypothetical protein